MIYVVHFSMWVYITIYKSLCDLWKTDFYAPPAPKVLYVSNITQDALLSVQNKSLLFYTHYFSNEWCDFFCFIRCKKKKKKVTAEIPHHQQKVPLKKCCYKMTWSNSPIKHQIIKSFTNTIPNTSRQLNIWGSWVGRWTFTSILVRKCA